MLQRCARFMSSGIYILRAEHWNASYDQIAHVGPYEDTQTRLLLAFLAFSCIFSAPCHPTHAV